MDIQRYTSLSAGASWIAEYDDPEDPLQWHYIKTFSPYHKIKTEIAYPPVLFYTATSDDRVNQAHTPKIAARTRKIGRQQPYFYENTEGRRSAAADKRQAVFRSALVSEFLWPSLNRGTPAA